MCRRAVHQNPRMWPAEFLDALGRRAQVAIALVPFLAALVMRLAFGKNRLTRAILSLSTTWFAINVLIAPYSQHLRQQILGLSRIFR